MSLSYRHILRTLLILLCGRLHSQTLTCQYNCPKIGEVFSIKTSSPVVHTSGVDQLWDFTQLQAVSSWAGTISYVDPASTPSSSLFSQANIAKLESGNYTFLETDFGGVKLAASSNVTVSSSSLLLPLPFSYGSSHQETIITVYNNGTDTIKVTTTKNLDGAGTGTLMLPTGTYTDVLRISGKIVESQTKNGLPDGYVITNNVNYYYSERISHPLMYTEYKFETGPADYAPFTQFVSSISTGIKSKENDLRAGILIGPNPTSGIVRVTLSEHIPADFVIIDLFGEVVLSEYGHIGTMELDIGWLPDGLYTFLVKQGEYIQSQKLVICH